VALQQPTRAAVLGGNVVEAVSVKKVACMMVPRYSGVIPAYNEERLLGRLLDSIAVARASYAEPDAVEVIVADNRSTDSTMKIAEARGCRVVSVEKRVIGAVRNAGAHAARGEILAFIDADSQVHARTFVEIDRALATGGVVGGATGVTMERWSLGIAVTYLMIVPMVLVTGMDTGVVFCRKQDFETIGGYDESRLVAEDVMLLLAMRHLGKSRGQRLARVTNAKAIASTRKFDEFGDWHYFSLAIEGVRHLRQRKPTELTERYWYKPKR
jgi:glycosyltransferase involved in cell wall biosynthesis